VIIECWLSVNRLAKLTHVKIARRITEAVLAGRPADQVEGHVLDGGEIGRGVIRTDAALVVAEDRVVWSKY
jgi:hypothetical protein